VSHLNIYEPGSTPVGDLCRIIVKNCIDKTHLVDFKNVHKYIEKQELSSFSQACLFLTSRSEIYDKLIRPEYEAGKIILFDRSIDSTTVYQGYAQQPKLINWIRESNKYILSGLNIDITYLLDLDVTITQERMNKRDGELSDRFQDKDIDFHNRVRMGYLEEASYFKERIHIIDVDDSILKIHNKVYSKFKEMYEQLF